MAPTSEATKLEGEGGFVEYVGCNKLKDKKALITGGECVPSLLSISGCTTAIQNSNARFLSTAPESAGQ